MCPEEKEKNKFKTSLDEQKCSKTDSEKEKDVEVVHEGRRERFRKL